MILNFNGIAVELQVPKIMAILNVTPDSFYDGGFYEDQNELNNRIDKIIAEGTDIIDVGGVSTRPGAMSVDSSLEIKRIEKPIEFILSNYPQMPISVDTSSAKTAEYFLNKGVHMINDISAGDFDKTMFETISKYNAVYAAMHIKGTPENMIYQNQYENGMMVEILEYFKVRVERMEQYGIRDIILDPGFGFAKNIKQNFSLLNKFHTLKIFGKPILVGLSRKSMVYKTLGIASESALNGTTALHMEALMQGANILRVHDVMEAKEVITLYQKLLKAR